MDLLINHLTRMRAGSICAAGIDLDTRKHVRIAATTNLPTRLLAENGGPLSLGGVVNAKPTWRQGPASTPPHVEDVRMKLHKLKPKNSLTEEAYWGHLESIARDTLAELFDDLVPHGRSTFFVESGKGNASLGCLKVRDTPTIYIAPSRRKAQTLRLRFVHGTGALYLPVTDIRLFRGNDFGIDEEAVDQFRKRLQESSETILSLGLTRAFPGRSKRPLHWLQVNNINVKPRGNA